MTRFGVVEALYLTELVGLVMIFIGYRLSVSTRPAEQKLRAAVAEASPAAD